METKLYQALLSHYNAKIQVAEANLLVYFKQPVGVGEHPDIVAELAKLTDQIAAAKGSMEVLQQIAQQNQEAATEAEKSD